MKIKSIISILKDSFRSIFKIRSISILFSSLARILILIGVNKLMTKELDFQNLSSYFLVMSTYNFFGSIIIGPFGDYINKIFFKIKINKKPSFFLESYYKKIFIPVAAISGILLVPILHFNFANNYFVEIPILISLMIIFRGVFDSNISFINALGYYKWFSILIICNSFFYLVFSYSLVSILKPTYFVWISGFLISNIIFSLITIYILRLKSNNSIDQNFNINYKVIKFVLPLFVTNLLLWFLTDGFRFLSELKYGLQKSGTLLLGLALSAQIFSLISNFLSPIFLPELLISYSEKNKINRYIFIKNYFYKIIPFLVIILVLSILFSKTIVAILVDRSKISDDLIIIFIVGLFIEFLRALINLIKSYKIAESKLIYQVYSLILPVLLLTLLYFIVVDSIVLFSFLILFIYIIYFFSSILFFKKLKNKSINTKSKILNL